MSSGTAVVTVRLPRATERELTEGAERQNTTRGELCRAILTADEPETVGIMVGVRLAPEEVARLREDEGRWGLSVGELVRRYL